jgi:hypothetical protein
LSTDENSHFPVSKNLEKPNMSHESEAPFPLASYLPPYPDIAKMNEMEMLTTENKMKILTSRWENVHTFNFPAR